MASIESLIDLIAEFRPINFDDPLSWAKVTIWFWFKESKKLQLVARLPEWLDADERSFVVEEAIVAHKEPLVPDANGVSGANAAPRMYRLRLRIDPNYFILNMSVRKLINF